MKKMIFVIGVLMMFFCFSTVSAETLVQDNSVVGVDEKWDVAIEVDEDMELTVMVDSNKSGDSELDRPKITIFFLDQAEYDNYKNGDSFQCYEECSDTDVYSMEDTTEVDKGTYYLLVRNDGPSDAYVSVVVDGEDTGDSSEDSPGTGVLGLTAALGSALVVVYKKK
ncbi:MAG: hypothetical protein R6U17_04460 [Thermoplasmata archaeon]